MNKGRKSRVFGLLTGLILLFFSTSLATAQTDTAGLQDRLTARKAQLKTRLTGAQTTRLKERCKAAQLIIANVNTRLKTVQSNRVNAYDKIIDHLNSLVSRVGNQADTTKLQADITGLKEKTASFGSNLTAYKVIIDDLQAMDCGADPSGFKASLEAAKSLQTQLKTDAAAIRAYLNEIIKPTIAALRVQLAGGQQEVIN